MKKFILNTCKINFGSDTLKYYQRAIPSEKKSNFASP